MSTDIRRGRGEGGTQKVTVRLCYENFPSGKGHKSTDSKCKQLRNRMRETLRKPGKKCHSQISENWKINFTNFKDRMKGTHFTYIPTEGK